MDRDLRMSKAIDILTIISMVLSIVSTLVTLFKEIKGLPYMIVSIGLLFFFFWLRKRISDNSTESSSLLDSVGRLLNRQPSNVITVEQAVAMLYGSFLDDRVENIAQIAPRLPNNLSGYEAALLLGDLQFSFRVNGIRILKSKLDSNLDPAEIDAILGALVLEYRTDAIGILCSE